MRAITGLRGIAAIYVVVYHVAGETRPMPNFGFDAILQHGYLAVDIFFIMSGFVMAATYASGFSRRPDGNTYLTFLVRRLGRIYPLYLLCTLATAAAYLANVIHIRPIPDLPHTLLWNVLLVQSWGLAPSVVSPAWSISVEWAAYMLFPLLLRLVCRCHCTIAMIVGLLCLTTLVGLSEGPDWIVLGSQPYREGLLDLVDPYSVSPLTRGIVGFALGLLGWRFREHAPTRHASLLAAVTVALLCVGPADVAIVGMCAVLVPALSAGNAFVTRALSHPAAHWLGVISYSVYLLHPRFEMVEFHAFHALSSRGIPQAETLAVLLELVVLIAVASVVYRVIEQPCREIVRQALGRYRMDRGHPRLGLGARRDVGPTDR